jgi:hypothetical protein
VAIGDQSPDAHEKWQEVSLGLDSAGIALHAGDDLADNRIGPFEIDGPGIPVNGEPSIPDEEFVEPDTDLEWLAGRPDGGEGRKQSVEPMVVVAGADVDAHGSGGFEFGQKRDGIFTQLLKVVATFLNDDRRQFQPGNPLSD